MWLIAITHMYPTHKTHTTVARHAPTAPLPAGTTQSFTPTALTLLPTAVTTPTPSVPLAPAPARSALVTGAASMVMATSVSPSEAAAASPRRLATPAASSCGRARRASRELTRAAAAMAGVRSLHARERRQPCWFDGRDAIYRGGK